MRIAIIDLGTNTFNLLIVDVRTKDDFKSLFTTKTAVKLGEGGIIKKIIAPPAFARGIATLKSYKGIIDKLKAEKTIAFATSAIRSSSNGAKFVAAAKKEANIEINVISGDREAVLIFEGVKLGLDIGEKHSLILDIGGGSNEFVIADREGIVWKKSFDMGVARLLEQFKPSDPITVKEIESLENYFKEVLAPLFDAIKQYPVKELIGSSGSFDTFADMIAHQFKRVDQLKGKTEFTFDMNEFAIIHDQLVRSTKEERQKTQGIIDLRVDMIVIGTLITNFIIRELNITHMRLSTYALKQGILADVMKRY